MRYLIFVGLSLMLSISCFGEEPFLRNIHQLTFSEMGFEKAGEAYFSPDDTSILFQAVPKGQTTYQIYRMDLDQKQPVLVSTGKVVCNCLKKSIQIY